MILLLSTNFDDDTNIVIEHLANLGEKFIRLNDIDFFNGKTKLYFSLNNCGVNLFVENDYIGRVNLDEVKVVWFRKFGFFEEYLKLLPENFLNNFGLLNYLHSEHRSTLSSILFFLKDKKWINHYSVLQSFDKIEVLQCAMKAGLKIPKTSIFNAYDEFSQSQFSNSITKSIRNGALVKINQTPFFFMTKEIKDTPPKSFFPSLIQEKIDKEYELRVFHLKGKNYAMAIFSQNDNQTKIDFRQYNYKKPNRCIPYLLSYEVDEKITILMKALKLDTGSIDLIKGIDGEYYFLEINPSGQFRMTSFPCNYDLHYQVAKTLIKMNNE